MTLRKSSARKRARLVEALRRVRLDPRTRFLTVDFAAYPGAVHQPGLCWLLFDETPQAPGVT